MTTPDYDTDFYAWTQQQAAALQDRKWQYQPTHRTRSWQVSIAQARDRISDVLERSHSLRDYPAQRLALAYRRARRDAITVTGLPPATFPEACPWPIAQVLDEDFWPEA